MKLIIYILLLISSKTLVSQQTFIINEDFDHFINIAYMVTESENAYQVIGLTIESDTSKQSPFVLELSKFGEYDNEEFSIYKNPNVNMVMNLNNQTFQDDNEVIFNCSTDNGLVFLSFDYMDSSISLLDSFFFEIDTFTVVDHFIPFENSFMICGRKEYFSNNDFKRDFLIMDLNSNRELSIKDSDYRKYCHRILEKNDSTFFAVISAKHNEGIDQFTQIIKFDNNLEKCWISNSAIESVDIEDAILDSNGDILFTSYSLFIVNPEDEYSAAYWTPQVEKVSSKGDFLWRRTMGTHFRNRGRFSKWSSIVESNNKDGYVIAGADYIDGTKRRSYATLAKYSSDGDSLWYRKYATIDSTEDFFHVFNDVIATQDGGYLAVGDQTYYDVSMGRVSTSLLIVKTDSLGLVVPDSTSSTVTLLEKALFHIFPNPAADYLYINKESSIDWNLSLLDINGKVILKKQLSENQITYLLDLKGYPVGEYFLNFSDGESQHTEKIVIGRL